MKLLLLFGAWKPIANNNNQTQIECKWNAQSKMIIECSINFQSELLPCAAKNVCRKFIHHRPMQTAALIQHQSQNHARIISSAFRTTRTPWLMSLLATISKIVIIACTLKATSRGIAAAASATASTASVVTWPPTFFHTDHIQCPSLVDNPTCPCYKFDDGNY